MNVIIHRIPHFLNGIKELVDLYYINICTIKKQVRKPSKTTV